MASFLTRMTGFPFGSRKWNPDEGIPDLNGRIAIVTGGNTGLGYVTTCELVKKGCKVYIACRGEERAKDAIARIQAQVPTAVVEYIHFDLTDIKSGQAAAEAIIAKEQRLDLIIANAGVMAFPYQLVRGIEVQFTNHTGHFALIQPLLPLLISTSKLPDSRVRIVNVSSLAHNFTGRPDFTTLEGANRPLSNTWARYGQSKLANILYSVELQKRLAGENIRVLSLHPGNVHTELTRGIVASSPLLGRITTYLSEKLAMTAAEGAKTQLFAATALEVDDHPKATYLVPIATFSKPSKLAQDPQLAADLYALSEKIVKDQLAA